MCRRYQSKNAVSFTMIMSFTTLGLAATGAYAEVITVDDDGKADFATIQAAIDYASDGDEILVAPGVYTSDHPAHVVDLLGKAITLRASDGPEVTFIDGEGVRRGIAFLSAEMNSTLIEGFTVRNGFSVGYDYDGDGEITSMEEYGGGIYIGGSSNLSITECFFRNNSSVAGGGLFNNGSDPTLIDCSFEGNSAIYGGGLLNSRAGSPRIIGCTFTNNSATGEDELWLIGGGMYNFESSPILDNCTFEYNTAGYNGWAGGMCNRSNSYPTLNNCTFTENSARYGGGMYNEESSPTLNNCMFIGNSTYIPYGSGAGMNNYQSSPTLNNCTFTENSSGRLGGGISNVEFSSPSLNNCTIENNSAQSVGGGMYNSWSSNSLTLTDTVVCGNTPDQVSGEWTEDGGNCRSLVCQDTNGDGRSDCDGGGTDEYLSVPDEYATIELAIDAAAEGALIEIAAGTYTPVVTINTLGKAIMLRGAVNDQGVPTTILDGQDSIRVLECTSGEGADTVFKNLIITGGRAVTGGGIATVESSPTMNNCTFNGNFAERGGGMSNWGNNSPTLTNCTFNGNFAERGGGMSNNSGSSPTLNNCTFADNSADDSGGGLYNYDSSPTLNICTFNGNAADYGGGMYNIYSDPTLEDSTLINNTAYDGGGMLNDTFANPTITDTLVCGNARGQIDGDWTDNGGNTVSDECPTDCPADFNGDGVVDGDELTYVLGAWGTDDPVADLDDDGIVGGADLNIILGAWGACP